MDDTCHGGASAVVDVGHGASDGSRSGDTSEERAHHVGDTLSHELLVAVVLVADDTVGHGSREERLDGSEHGNHECGRHELGEHLPCDAWHLGLGHVGIYGEAVSDGLDGGHSGIVLEEQRHDGHHDDGHERSGELLADLRCVDDDEDATDTDEQGPDVHGAEVLEVDHPLADKVGRHLGNLHAEEVLDLCCEDGQRDTAREAHDDGVRDVLDDGTHAQHAHEDEEDTRHEGGDDESVHTIVGDDAEDDDDERSRGTADLYLATSEDRDEQARDDGCDDTLLGCYARGYTKGDGQWQGYDTYDDTGHKVGHERSLVVSLEAREQLGLKIKEFHTIKCLYTNTLYNDAYTESSLNDI